MYIHAEELISFHKYLRVRLHLRPADRMVDAASIFFGGHSFPLSIEHKTDAVNGDFIELSLDQLTPAGFEASEAGVVLSFADGQRARFDRIAERQFEEDPLITLTRDAFATFRARLSRLDVLELASRDRDGTRDAATFLRDARSYTGIDIVDGPNVNVVGDVHVMSEVVPAEAFDLVYSQWGFEHFANPFVVATQINTVLRTGGEALILSNQTTGLHDEPWDFWRFSTSAWRSIFNEQTGFEIIRVEQGEPMQITPRRFMANYGGHEGPVGCKSSGAWVRKIAHRPLQWPVESARVADLLTAAYPRNLRND